MRMYFIRKWTRDDRQSRPSFYLQCEIYKSTAYTIYLIELKFARMILDISLHSYVEPDY